MLKLKRVLSLCIFSFFFFPALLFAQIEITVIDVGQGDAVLIEVEDAVILIDGGRSMYDVSDYLRNKGFERIDLVVATHAHADHIGGLIGVLKRLDVDMVLYNGQTHTTQTFERFIDEIFKNKIKYHEPDLNNSFVFGDIKLQTLYHPAP